MLAVDDVISKQMVKFASNITKESIIDVEGIVVPTAQIIEACSQKNVEVLCSQLYVVSSAEPVLPLQIEDAARPENVGDEVSVNLNI